MRQAIRRLCIALIGMGTLATGPIDANAELVGYWDFDESTVDRSGSGLDGIRIGDARYDDDTPESLDSSHSILLDGEGDWVALGNPSRLNFSTNDWTVAGWMKTTRAGLGDENEGTLFGNGGDWNGGVRYTIVLSEGNREGVPTLVIDDNAAPPGSSFNKHVLVARTVVNDGVWHHIAGVRTDDQLQIYVDGVLEGRSRIQATYDLTGVEQHPAYIGAITDNRNGEVFKAFDGHLDDVAIWNDALSGEMIAGLASGTFTPITVPEPASALLFMTAAMACLVRRSQPRAGCKASCGVGR